MERSRSDFFKKALVGTALFTIVPRRVLGSMGTGKFVAPSDQLTKGIIGCGSI